MSNRDLKILYSRLRGIKEQTSSDRPLRKIVGDDYNSIVRKLSVLLKEDFSDYLLPDPFTVRGSPDYCPCDLLKTKLLQLIPVLETGYGIAETVVEIGSIYNSIKDEDLKNRCSDILSAQDNFDRVINQATLVLEDRIRSRAGLDKKYSGVNLVNMALNSDIKKTILQVSDDPDEHEGICHICRGVALSFRNPTHHYISDDFTREQALQICAFIDNLLSIIDAAKKVR